MNQTIKYLKIFCYLLLLTLTLCFLFFVLPKVIVFFMPFVVGFILSLIANPLVRFLEKKIKIKRKYGTVLMIIFVIAALIFACYGIGLLLAIGIRQFMEYMPTMYENARIELNMAASQLESLLRRIPILSNLEISELGSITLDLLNKELTNYKSAPFSAISDFAMRIPDILVSVIMGLLATYFFIADRDKLLSSIRNHIPESLHQKNMLIYAQMIRAIGGYFKAQFKIMGVIYLVITIGLMIIRVNFAWLIGFGIAFLDMLPVFGTGTVLIPWAVIKVFSGNYPTAAGMILLYAVSLVTHQLIQPKLVGQSIGLDAFATLFFMYIGYQFKGVLGMIVAIPAGMILCNLYEAGAFDHLIWCLNEIIKDIRNFCKIEHVKKEH